VQVTVTPFETEEEAIEMANSVEYGLASSVWTENLKRAHRVAQEIKSGTVWVNTWLKACPRFRHLFVFPSHAAPHTNATWCGVTTIATAA
jgi:acyl-CoA reductase-like NAD-dependent aldehyde dehydrogenase